MPPNSSADEVPFADFRVTLQSKVAQIGKVLQSMTILPQNWAQLSVRVRKGRSAQFAPNHARARRQPNLPNYVDKHGMQSVLSRIVIYVRFSGFCVHNLVAFPSHDRENDAINT